MARLQREAGSEHLPEAEAAETWLLKHVEHVKLVAMPFQPITTFSNAPARDASPLCVSRRKARHLRDAPGPRARGPGARRRADGCPDHCEIAPSWKQRYKQQHALFCWRLLVDALLLSNDMTAVDLA